MRNMDSIVKEELDRYVSFISKIDWDVRIYLYGSCAYGAESVNLTRPGAYIIEHMPIMAVIRC